MSKYVRTTDGIIDSNQTVRRSKVVKYGETIVELCDKFVCVGGDYRDIYTRVSDRNYNLEAFSVYGAIWTDKGLIYVAKMNEKGEFELL